jgi:hypothetical protein
MEALARGREKIKENAKLRHEQKKIEASKLLLSKGIELPPKNPKRQPVLNLPAEEGDDTGESSEEEQQMQHVRMKKKPKEEVEEEIVYIKKAKAKAAAPKKKKKKIIVYQDASSDSDGESDSSDSENYVLRDNVPEPRPQAELHRTSPSATSSPIYRQQAELHKFKSQRNKKSLVKVYDTPVKRQPEHQQINYFCD